MDQPKKMQPQINSTFYTRFGHAHWLISQLKYQESDFLRLAKVLYPIDLPTLNEIAL